jgi:hypothetical protein
VVTGDPPINAAGELQEPTPEWVAARFGVSLQEAEWTLVLYRFSVLYPGGPEPGRFFCEAL